MAERADVVVVGGGVMGLAAAWALRRAGREVLVLEQFRIGHTHGSSHGAGRIFRLAYDEPEWVRLAQEALPLWRELEAESGGTLLELTEPRRPAPRPRPPHRNSGRDRHRARDPVRRGSRAPFRPSNRLLQGRV